MGVLSISYLPHNTKTPHLSLTKAVLNQDVVTLGRAGGGPWHRLRMKGVSQVVWKKSRPAFTVPGSRRLYEKSRCGNEGLPRGILGRRPANLVQLRRSECNVNSSLFVSSSQ